MAKINWVRETTWKARYRGYDIFLTATDKPLPYSYKIFRGATLVFESKELGHLENSKKAAKEIVDMAIANVIAWKP